MSEIDADIMEKAHRAYFDPFEGEDHASGNAIIVSIARAIQAAKDEELKRIVAHAEQYAQKLPTRGMGDYARFHIRAFANQYVGERK